MAQTGQWRNVLHWPVWSLLATYGELHLNELKLNNVNSWLLSHTGHIPSAQQPHGYRIERQGRNTSTVTGSSPNTTGGAQKHIHARGYLIYSRDSTAKLQRKDILFNKWRAVPRALGCLQRNKWTLAAPMLHIKQKTYSEQILVLSVKGKTITFLDENPGRAAWPGGRHRFLK